MPQTLDLQHLPRYPFAAWDDQRVEGFSTRPGLTVPTDEYGFRGDADFAARNFVHTQPDEVQFAVQMSHDWEEKSRLYPHVHYCLWTAAPAAAGAVQFILEYYMADIMATFPAAPSQFVMTDTWTTAGHQWEHRLMYNLVTPFPQTAAKISNVWKCRLYRDNTVANNFAGKVTFLYFDVHYLRDAPGSLEERTKNRRVS